jgi:hypothetical protein
VREGRILVAVFVQTHQAVWACVNPISCQSILAGVPPQAHEGMTLRIIGPVGLSRGLLSFQWTLAVFDFDKECLENKSVEPLLLNSE